MPYRCLMVVNPARIRCRNEPLLIETDSVHSVPIEDISAIVLESRQSTVTAAAMATLAQNGTVIFWCDETHLPCGVSLPFAQHSRQLGVLRWQMELTLPTKKRMWQQIVTAKIQNQAECLALCGKAQEAAFLFGRAKSVTSGDKDNLEAAAAAYYFPALFGTGYTRRSEDARNAALNYAYAILRGYMARCLAVRMLSEHFVWHACSMDLTVSRIIRLSLQNGSLTINGFRQHLPLGQCSLRLY